MTETLHLLLAQAADEIGGRAWGVDIRKARIYFDTWPSATVYFDFPKADYEEAWKYKSDLFVVKEENQSYGIFAADSCIFVSRKNSLERVKFLTDGIPNQ